MNLYVIMGAVLAAWAVLIALLGLRGFPTNRAGERAVVGITAVLFVGAVGSAIADTTKVGERKGKHTAEHKEPEEAPDQGAGAAAEPGSQQSPSEAPEEAPAAPPAEQGGGNLALAADPTGQLKFDKTTLEAPAGKVTIVMTNDSPVPHDVAIRGSGVEEKGETVSGGKTSTATAADLKAGEYEFLCTVPGHEQAGMKGTLTVE